MSRESGDLIEREPHVAVWFFVAGRALEQRVMAALRAAGHDVTLAQGRLAARIDEGGTRLTRLAESAQVTKQTAGVLVDQLEGAGYVERVPDPADARAKLVRLAPRGREMQRLARQVEDEVDAEWTAHLGEREMAQLRSTMARLREVTDPYRA
jgi:DNA-binding MarR family transcriptional regulator